MRELKEASQYNVLKKVAHEMDRDVVRPGQVRVSAAAARGAAAARTGSKRNTDNVGAKPKAVRKPDPIQIEWEKTDDAKRLRETKDAVIKRVTNGNPVKALNDEEKAEIATASKNLRESYQLFRTNKVGQAKDEEKKGSA